MADMVGMKWRLIVFVSITVAALLTISLWPAQWLRYRSFGMPMDLALTWWAPSLLLLVPASMCWVGFGADDRRGARIWLSMSAALFALFILLMWYVNDFIQPWCGLWQGCIGNWSLQN